MDITLVYAIVISSMFGGFCLIRIIAFAHSLVRNHLLSYILRNIIYPTLANRVPILRHLTPCRTVLALLYIGGTIFCNVWGVDNVSQASFRAAWISVATMILLFVTGRISVAMDILQLSFSDVRAAHGAAGLMATSQTAAHIAIELRKAQLRLSKSVDFFGFLAAIGLAAMLVLLIFRKWRYQLFIRSHALLALFIATTVWLHPHPGIMMSRPYLVAAVGAYGTVLVVQTSTFLVQNTIMRSRCAKATLLSKGDGVRIRLNFRSNFRLRPGQFVYLWIPGISIWSLFRKYPFMVCWKQPEMFEVVLASNQDEKISELAPIDAGPTLTMLVQPSSKLALKLRSLATTNHSFHAWVDGPYGHVPDWSTFDHLIFVASGVGIAAQMLAIKFLIEGHEQRTIATRTISLYWRIDDACKQILTHDFDGAC